MSLILGHITLDVLAHNEKVMYVAEAKEVERIVLIRTHIEWTPERVEEEIDKVFPDAPIMKTVAWCESRLLPEATGPTQDAGVFQIHLPTHGRELELRRLDPYDVKENLEYARVLYDQSGLSPWSASRKCWSGV